MDEALPRSKWIRRPWSIFFVFVCIVLISSVGFSRVISQRQKAAIARLEQRGVKIEWTDSRYHLWIEAALLYLDLFPNRTQTILRLDSNNAAFNDDDLRAIGNLNQVIEIQLRGANISDRGVRQLANSKELIRLDLSGTRITGEGLKSLSSLTNLADLHLENTNISDNGLVYLQNLKNLESLVLHDTNVTLDGLKVFRGMASIGHLSISHCPKLPQSLVDFLSSFPNLSLLYLEDLPITDEVVRELSQIQQLETLATLKENFQLSEEGLKETFDSTNHLSVEIVNKDLLYP